MTQHHHVAIWNGSIVGEASTKEEAIAVVQRAGHHVVQEKDGGNIDFYDAEDGPKIQGYEADGKGVWIITTETV